MKKFTRFHLSMNEIFLIIFSGVYLIGFSLYFYLSNNPEFFWYTIIVIILFALVAGTIRKTNFPPIVLWGLSIWGLLHMAGGSIPSGGASGVLYSWQIFHIVGSGEYFILKYDQLVHFYGFGVATAVGYALLRPSLNEKTNWKVIALLLVLIGAGFGVINEIIEFMPVLFMNQTGVGGYGNLILDLIFNTAGAIAAVIIITFIRRKDRSDNQTTGIS